MKLNDLLRPLTRQSRRNKSHLLASASRAAAPSLRINQHVEPLENRQMLSLTVSIETTSGASSATVTSVGQTLNLQIVATITGSTAGSNDGIDSLCGSILSTLSDGSYSVGGNLEDAIPTGPFDEFQANGAQEATSQDLNGDGYLDAGSNNNADIAGFYNARAGGIANNGTISGDSNTFDIGTLNYVVTNLNYGQPTDINFRLRSGLSAGAYDAIWQQDGEPYNDSTQTVLIGSPLVVTDPNLTAPAGGSISGTVTGTSFGVSSTLSGVTMFLNTTGSTSYAAGDVTTGTSSSGAYDFEGLKAGTYYVGEELPTGYSLSSPSSTITKVTLATSQNVSAQDFIDAGTGSIAGTVSKVVSGVTSADSGVTVYLDLNDSGTLTSGDPTEVTSSSGAYDFTGLGPDTYLLRQVVPSGYKQTAPANDPTLLTISGNNDAITGQNFTNTTTAVAATGTISGTVDKVVSGSTSGESGVTVYLDSNDNGSLDSGEPTATTSSTGTFSFTGLAAGTYYLREVIPTGYTQTSPSSSPTKITLTSGQTSSGDNFTNTASTVAPTASIDGTVYKDISGTTTGDGGVTVYLDLNDTGSYVSGDPTITTFTSGAYSFTKLAAGTYFLREEIPSGYTQTSPASAPTTITLTNGQVATAASFTLTESNATISGTVSKVVSGTTSVDSGVTVYLDLADSGSLASGDPSTTTSSTGTYSFAGLAPGTYYLREVVPTGYTQTSPSTSPTTITLTAGQTVTGENFTDTAATVSATASISGEVYSDVNKSGKLVSGDAGIPGVTVYIDLKKDGKDDSGDPSTTTSSTGAYTFTGLAAGTYLVREQLLSGDSFTSPSAGDISVIVASGAKITGENFGNTGALNLPGLVFNDINGDGKEDGSDAGLSGWVVYCDLKNTGTFVASDNNKTTITNGTFDFVSLTAGTYIIRVVPKSGYTLESPTAGYYTVVLQPGLPVTGINFAEHPTSANTAAGMGTGAITLSGTVFDDLAGTGVQSANDPGLAGWVVYCDLKDTGTFVASDNNKTTLSDGSFEFVSLTAGTYTVRVVPVAGYTQTLPNDGYYTVTLAAGDPVTIAFGEHES